MRRYFTAFIAAVAIAIPAVAAPAGLKPFDADYVANYEGMEGAARMTLSQSDGKWVYVLRVTNSLATLSQSTTFDEKDGQWRPLSGTDSSAVFIKHKDKRAHYDWDKGVATYSGDVKPDRTGPVKLQAGDLDAMLVNLALTRDVHAGKPLRYRMVDDGRVKQLNYQVTGTEAITIGGRSQQATRITRTDGDKQEVLWVVDGLPVPARILRRKGGEDEMDLRLKSLH